MNKIKLIAAVFILGLFQSCAVIYEVQDQVYYNEIGDGFELYVPEWIDEIESFDEIVYYIRQNIRPLITNDIDNHGCSDYWQSPKETCKSGTGDCEDFAILFIDIACLKFGYRCGLAALDHENNSFRSVVNGGNIDHAVVECNGEYIESVVCNEKELYYYDNPTIGYIYTFDELFK